jgi:hypothetical protein
MEGRETFGIGKFAEADIKDNVDKYRFTMNEAEQADFLLAKQAAAEGRTLTLRDRETMRRNLNSLQNATHSIEPLNPNSVLAPSDFHNIVLGANQTMMPSAPKPEGTTNLEKIREIIMDIAFAILGIIPQILNPQVSLDSMIDR